MLYPHHISWVNEAVADSQVVSVGINQLDKGVNRRVGAFLFGYSNSSLSHCQSSLATEIRGKQVKNPGVNIIEEFKNNLQSQ